MASAGNAAGAMAAYAAAMLNADGFDASPVLATGEIHIVPR